jgi:hypothetical protein
MFDDQQRAELIGRMMIILTEQKAGKADARADLAALLVDATREYLASQYTANFNKDHRPDGIFQTRDVIDKDDFKSG